MIEKTSRPEQNRSDNLESYILTMISTLSDTILTAKNDLLKIWGMTALQHNALQIIYEKDTQNKGLSSREIRQGLTTRVPDVTRLLDRLAEKGWVIRERDANNRRVVRTRLTNIGVELVKSAANPMRELQETLLSRMTTQEKETFADLLKQICKD